MKIMFVVMLNVEATYITRKNYHKLIKLLKSILMALYYYLDSKLLSNQKQPSCKKGAAP